MTKKTIKKLFKTIRYRKKITSNSNSKAKQKKRTMRKLFKVYQPRKLISQSPSNHPIMSLNDIDSKLLITNRQHKDHSIEYKDKANGKDDDNQTISDILSIPDFFNDKIDYKQLSKQTLKYEAISFNNFDEIEDRDLYMISKDTIYSLLSEDY